MSLTTTQLASELDLSKGRISQMVKDGVLDGCYEGEGRARRFDLVKVAAALNRKLDPGQMLGNGRGTKKNISALASAETEPKEDGARARRDGPLAANDPDRYELARTQKAEEEARRLRRVNQLEAGTLVLAEVASRDAARVISKEVAQFEDLLRRGARAIADKMGVDFKEARQILMTLWREHRDARADMLSQAAEAAPMREAEKEADF